MGGLGDDVVVVRVVLVRVVVRVVLVREVRDDDAVRVDVVFVLLPSAVTLVAGADAVCEPPHPASAETPTIVVTSAGLHPVGPTAAMLVGLLETLAGPCVGAPSCFRCAGAVIPGRDRYL